MTFLLLCFMCACVFAYTVYPSMCFHTGQKRTKPLQVLNSLSTVMVWSVFRTTRYWSAPAGCMFTNSPLTFRAATSPSSLLYIPVSVTCCVSCALVHFLNTADNTSYWSFSLLPPARKPHVFFKIFLSPTPVKEIQLVHSLSSSEATHTMMRTQYEWLFISMTVSNKTVCMFHLKQDVIIYTVSMQWKQTFPLWKCYF